MQEDRSKESNREKLLRGALECIQQRGYANTSSRDIAATSGANVASINYHFGSKQALLDEALGRCFEMWSSRLRSTVGGVSNGAAGGLTAALSSAIDSFGELRDAVHACVESFAPALRSEALRERIAAGYANVRSTGADLARQTLDAGGIDAPDNLDNVMSVLVAVCDGLMLQWIADPDAGPDATETVRALAQIGAIARHS